MAIAVAVPPALAMRRFRVLIAGNAVSSYGTFLNQVALSLYAYKLTGSALRTGVFMALRLGSGSLAGGFAGRLCARFSYRSVMLAANLAQAAVMTAIVVVPQGLRQPTLYALAVVTGLSGTVFAVALRSAIPALVGAEERQRANGLVVTGRAVAMVAGFASAGVVVAALDYRAAFLIDAATFLVSAATIAALPLRGHGEAAAAVEKFRLRDLDPVLLNLVFVHAIIGLGSGSFHVTLPVYSTAVRGEGAATFMSAFWTAWALGSLAAHHVVVRYARRKGLTMGTRVYLTGIFTMSLSSIAVYAGAPLAATLLVSALVGLASATAEIAFYGRLQLLDEPTRSRAVGFSVSSESAGFGAGMLLGALLLGAWPPFAVLAAVTGLAVALAAGFAALTLRKRVR